MDSPRSGVLDKRMGEGSVRRIVLINGSSTEEESGEEDLATVERDLVVVKERLSCLQAEKSEALGVIKSEPSSQSDEEEYFGIDPAWANCQIVEESTTEDETEETYEDGFTSFNKELGCRGRLWSPHTPRQEKREGRGRGKQVCYQNHFCFFNNLKIQQMLSQVVRSRSPLRNLNCCQEEEEVGEGNAIIGSSNVKQSRALPTYSYDPRRLRRGAVWDSHCHLDLLANRLRRVGVRRGENLETTLERDGEGLEDKFGGCIANFCEPRSWCCGPGGREVVDELRNCMVQSRVFLAIGCHPRFADQLGGLQLQRLELLARGRKGGLVAIGECGLDLSTNNKLSLNVQRKAFAAQVSLGKPSFVKKKIFCEITS